MDNSKLSGHTPARFVYVTTDYDQFHTVEGNRDIDWAHVSKLAADFKRDGQIPAAAIVNEDMGIIDGQHRREVCKLLQLPFYYDIIEGTTSRECVILNKNHASWSTEDFLVARVNEGRKDYIEYQKFKEEFKFDHKVNIALLT
jgi:hypothetical protein